VATQLQCGGIFNNHFIANCPQSVPVKKFWKSVHICQRYEQLQSGTFFWDTVYDSANENVWLILPGLLNMCWDCLFTYNGMYDTGMLWCTARIKFSITIIRTDLQGAYSKCDLQINRMRRKFGNHVFLSWDELEKKSGRSEKNLLKVLYKLDRSNSIELTCFKANL